MWDFWWKDVTLRRGFLPKRFYPYQMSS